LEGDELWVGYDVEIEFPAGLTRVKENTLSEIGSGSRIRAAGLSGLRSDKAKTLSQDGFSLIPKPGSG
jgi:hypothetical protein